MEIEKKKKFFKKYECKNFSHYKLEKLINYGGFGAIFQSINLEDNKNYAIKMILKDNIDNKQNFFNECNIMKNLKSKNIIEYYDNFEEKFENEEFYFIVMELCDSNLLEYLDKKKKISLDELRGILIQFNNGLKYMFDKNIMHRDIKPENILIKYDKNNKYIIKLSDFGLSKILSESGYASSIVGTNIFMAPEIIYKNKYTKKSDLYSIGKMLFFFNNKNYINSNFILNDLIEKLTQFDTEKRINEKEYFKHQFFKEEKEKWKKYFKDPSNYDLNKYIIDEELIEIKNIFPKIEDNLEINRIDNNNEYYYGECKKQFFILNVYHGVGIYLNKNEKYLYKGQFKDGKVNGKGMEYFSNGDRFEGEYKDGKKDGKGIYYNNNGTRYEGDYKDDKRNGKGIFYYNNGDRFEGEYKDGKKNGKAIHYSNNGDRFEGNYKDGKRNGKGIVYFNNGDRFEGEFKDDKAKGIKYYNDGERFEGEYKDGKRNGKGIYYYNNGDRYEGEYKDDKAKGKGIHYYNNGDRYEGEYKDGKRNGKGIKYVSNGDRYEVEYKDGKWNGKGIKYVSNGERYEGEFKDDKMNGKGIYYFNNGDRYKGEYKNDKRNGKGIYYYNNGDRYEGEFIENSTTEKGIFYYCNGNKYEFEFNENRQCFII